MLEQKNVTIRSFLYCINKLTRIKRTTSTADLHLQPSSEDTSFNIGTNNVARNIKVDPDELPLQETKHTQHEEAKLRLNTLKWVKTSDRMPDMTLGLPDDMRYLPTAHLQCSHAAG